MTVQMIGLNTKWNKLYLNLHKKLHHEITLTWKKIEKYFIGIKYFRKAFKMLKILHMTILVYKYT